MKLINRGLLTFFSFFAAVTSQAATLVATNSAQFTAAIKSAQGGDTIVLNGTFGASYIKNKAWTSTVTLDATNATFTNALAITNTSNLTIVGGHYGSRTDSLAYNRAIYVNGGNQINIVDPVVVGAYGGGGIGISNVTNASVTGGTFFGLKVGISFGSVSNGLILNNTATGMVSDGFDVADSHNIRISFNSCTDGTPTTGMHPDCVQLWSYAGNAPQSNIEVSDNYASGLTQGFTSFDPDAGGLVDSLFARNRTDTYYPQGLACYACFNTVISDNILNTLPGAPHLVNLNVIGGGNNTVTNNVKSGFDPALARPLPTYTIDGLRLAEQTTLASSAAAVPEPSTWAMLIAGFGMIGALRRRATARGYKTICIPS